LKGCCEVSLAGESAGLRRLWVMPHHRLQSVGSVLFAASIDEARQRGKLALSFSVRKDNAVASLFYGKLGAVIFHDDAEDYWMSVPLVEEQLKRSEPDCEHCGGSGVLQRHPFIDPCPAWLAKDVAG
jgi:hypothetical protein